MSTHEHVNSRGIKHIPMIFSGEMMERLLANRKTVTRRPVKSKKYTPEELINQISQGDYSNAIAAPGDHIWVRETFAVSISGKRLYRAGAIARNVPKKWTPSIHMPKRHSRLTLRVTKVTIEQVQDITDEDAVAEGMPTPEEAMERAIDAGLGWYQRPAVFFKFLWTGIYGNRLDEDRPYGWNKNPHVWRVEFVVVPQYVHDAVEFTKPPSTNCI